MKISINLADLTADDIQAVYRVIAELDDGTPKPVETEPAAELVAEEPKKKRKSRANKAAPIEPEVVDEADPFGVDDASEVTLDDIKGAVKSRIERDSIEAVKEIFATFKAGKLSDLDEADFAAVFEALTADQA